MKQAIHISEHVTLGAEYELGPCHDSLLIGAYNNYTHMMLEAKRKWIILLHQHRVWTKFRNSLLEFEAGGGMEEDEVCRLDPQLL